MQENLRKCIKCKHLFEKEDMSFYKNTKRFICNDCKLKEYDTAITVNSEATLPKNLFARTKGGEWSRYGIDTRPSVPTVYWVNRANVMFILFRDKPFYRRSKIVGSWIGNQIPKYKAYFEGKLNLK